MLKLFQYNNEPLVNLSKQYLRSFNINVADSELNEYLLSHPDYPSLLSLSDALSEFGIQNAGLKIEADNLEQLPQPFIGYLAREFKLIEILTAEKVVSIENDGSKTIYSREIFNKKWSEIALIGELSDVSQKQKREQETKKITKNRSIIATLAITFVLLLFSSFSSFRKENDLALSVVYLLHIIAKSIGAFISVLLIWYEIDKYNLSLKRFCSGIGNRANCNAVLNSRYSKIFGNITWSEIGIIYFTSSLFSLLFYMETLPLIQLLILISGPYILFSFYFQAYIIKEWCPFCVAIQIILFIELILASIYIVNKPMTLESNIQTDFSLDMNQFIKFGSIFLLSSITLYSLKPLFEFKIENKNIRFDYARLKRNKNIFNSILINQRKVDNNWKNIGIKLGNIKANNTLLKVCNPYCDPCSKAHPDINELLDNNNDINVQIVYNASLFDYDISKYPVRHFLALSENENENILRNALDFWYLNRDKNYEKFALTFQEVNSQLSNQDVKIKEMYEWVNFNQITHTPSYFFNGIELPIDYKISDLKHIKDI